uniref:Protein kinase domain-containing protein n=1 Tax=Mesocestoides corti TaxID=53468 RepID=A0A5K3ET56_MESCO
MSRRHERDYPRLSQRDLGGQWRRRLADDVAPRSTDGGHDHKRRRRSRLRDHNTDDELTPVRSKVVVPATRRHQQDQHLALMQQQLAAYTQLYTQYYYAYNRTLPERPDKKRRTTNEGSLGDSSNKFPGCSSKGLGDRMHSKKTNQLKPPSAVSADKHNERAKASSPEEGEAIDSDEDEDDDDDDGEEEDGMSEVSAAGDRSGEDSRVILRQSALLPTPSHLPPPLGNCIVPPPHQTPSAAVAADLVLRQLHDYLTRFGRPPSAASKTSGRRLRSPRRDASSTASRRHRRTGSSVEKRHEVRDKKKSHKRRSRTPSSPSSSSPSIHRRGKRPSCPNPNPPATYETISSSSSGGSDSSADAASSSSRMRRRSRLRKRSPSSTRRHPRRPPPGDKRQLPVLSTSRTRRANHAPRSPSARSPSTTPPHRATSDSSGSGCGERQRASNTSPDTSQQRRLPAAYARTNHRPRLSSSSSPASSSPSQSGRVRKRLQKRPRGIAAQSIQGSTLASSRSAASASIDSDCPSPPPSRRGHSRRQRYREEVSVSRRRRESTGFGRRQLPDSTTGNHRSRMASSSSCSASSSPTTSRSRRRQHPSLHSVSSHEHSTRQ